MPNHYITRERFYKIDFSKNKINAVDFEQCEFVDCHFNSIDLSEINFIDCQFNTSDLSLAKIENTSFQNVTFNNCKMIGFNLTDCNQFGLKVKFDACTLNESSFYNIQLPKTHFKDCQLKNVDFGYANISQSYFENCDLQQAIFDQTNLEKSNWTTAYNFIINPNENKIKNAKFSKENCIGLLHHFQIKID